MFKKVTASLVILTFSCTSIIIPKSHAVETQNLASLPIPGTMVNLSPAFEPTLIKGLTVHKDNPFLFDFIVDTGNSGLSVETQDLASLHQEGDRLVKYFFACLTVPEKDLWVNLSPYEKDRIVPEALGQTALGRDLLAQDYILKQLTASLIYPEKDLGKEFWNRVYAKAQAIYGPNAQIPVNTFNKVWILADKASVYEHGQTAFVVDGHLKVMLEEDYLARDKNQMPTRGHVPNKNNQNVSPSRLPSETALNVKATQGNTPNVISSQIIRDIVIPEIEKEVNTGKNFATLRQIFNSQILAIWYKKNLKEALINQVYSNKNTIKGVNLSDPSVKEQIYQQYLQAYKKGVFNYIKEDPLTDAQGKLTGQRIPRKYFSGGYQGPNEAMLSVSHNLMDAATVATPTGSSFQRITTALNINGAFNPQRAIAVKSSDSAMLHFNQSNQGYSQDEHGNLIWSDGSPRGFRIVFGPQEATVSFRDQLNLQLTAQQTVRGGSITKTVAKGFYYRRALSAYEPATLFVIMPDSFKEEIDQWEPFAYTYENPTVMLIVESNFSERFGADRGYLPLRIDQRFAPLEIAKLAALAASLPNHIDTTARDDRWRPDVSEAMIAKVNDMKAALPHLAMIASQPKKFSDAAIASNDAAMEVKIKFKNGKEFEYDRVIRFIDEFYGSFLENSSRNTNFVEILVLSRLFPEDKEIYEAIKNEYFEGRHLLKADENNTDSIGVQSYNQDQLGKWIRFIKYDIQNKGRKQKVIEIIERQFGLAKGSLKDSDTPSVNLGKNRYNKEFGLFSTIQRELSITEFSDQERDNIFDKPWTVTTLCDLVNNRFPRPYDSAMAAKPAVNAARARSKKVVRVRVSANMLSKKGWMVKAEDLGSNQRKLIIEKKEDGKIISYIRNFPTDLTAYELANRFRNEIDTIKNVNGKSIDSMVERFSDFAMSKSFAGQGARSTDASINKGLTTDSAHSSSPGGIDLNSANMGMSVMKDVNGEVKVNFDPAMIARIKVQGIFSAEPVIIQITPLNIMQMRPLLGLKDNSTNPGREQEQLAKI